MDAPTCRNCARAVTDPPCPHRDFMLRPRSCGKYSWLKADRREKRLLKEAIVEGTRGG